jgi:hypothetical protein
MNEICPSPTEGNIDSQKRRPSPSSNLNSSFLEPDLYSRLALKVEVLIMYDLPGLVICLRFLIAFFESELQNQSFIFLN